MGRAVGSGKTVNISVRTSGIDNGESATIEIFKKKGNESLDSLSASVSEGRVTTEWTAKGPGEDDEDQQWECYYVCKCKGLETKAQPLTVFTDWVEITSVDEDDQALPDAEFKLQIGSDSRERNTGSSGVRKEEHLPGPGTVQIKWLKPYELIEWVDEDGPKRKAKVRRVETAKLVYPEKGEHTQWVNLEASEEEPSHGSLLKLKVTLIEAKAGAKGYAKVRFGDENSVRNDPQPELKGGSQTDWCEEGEFGLEFELPKDDGEQDCEYELELELGMAGCDTATVMVGGTTDCADEQVVISTKRKIYYQLTRFADATIPPFDGCKTALEQVGIDYEEYSVVEFAESDPPAGSFQDGEPLKREGPQLIVGEHNLQWFHDKFQDDKAPLGAHVIVCDWQYDGGESGSYHEQTLEAEAQFSKKTIEIVDPHLYDALPIAIQTGESAVLSGSTWESAAPSGHPDNGKNGQLTADDVVFGVGTGLDRVQVVLPDDAKAIVGDGELFGDHTETSEEVKHPVKVTLKLHVARGPFLGESCKVHQVIVKVPNEGRFNEVLVHELGHSLGETLSEVPPGLDEGDHGRAYEGKEHQGHHCGYGLSDDEFSNDDFSYLKGDCAMFGAGEDDKPPASGGTFCKLCEPFVRANPCTSLQGAKGKLNWDKELGEGDPDDEDRGAPALATLEIYQEGLGEGKVLMGSFPLEPEGGAFMNDTPQKYKLGWKDAEATVAEFGAAQMTKDPKVAVQPFERNLSAEHVLRSRYGRGKYRAAPKVHRPGYMFAPADTPEADLLPSFLWKNARPRQEKVFSVHVQFEGADTKHQLYVLHPKDDVSGDTPYDAFELKLSAKLVLTEKPDEEQQQTPQTDQTQQAEEGGGEPTEHELTGTPGYTFTKHWFLEDAAKSKAALKTQLIKEYANSGLSNPVHARDWVANLQATSTAASLLRSAISTAVSFINGNLPADKNFSLNEWELAVTFLTEGGISTLKEATRSSNEDPEYSGYSDLGIDSYVTRWKSNSNSIRSYTSAALTQMINDKTNIEWNTNEANDRLETFSYLKTEDAAHAVGGLLAEAKWAFAEDMADEGVVGKWAGKVDDLPAHIQFFWTTLYYNTGTGNGKKTLRNQGLKYHDNIFNQADDHYSYAHLEKYNANWRTATFRLFKKEIATWG